MHMDSLKELREWFLEDPETRAAAFKIADYYLVSYDDDPQNWSGSFGTNCCRVFLLETYRRRDAKI